MLALRFNLVLFTLATTLILAGKPADAAQPLESAVSNPAKGFLLFDNPDQKDEAKALLDAFQATSYGNFRHKEGIPGSGDTQQIFFEKENEIHPLEKWPGMELRYSNGELYLKDGNDEHRLTEVNPLPKEYSEWPLASVAVGDIDSDGRPDFFILTHPTAVGSPLSHLLDWDRKNSKGQPLFAPFPANQLPPSPDDYKEWLFFDKGTGPLPNFKREKKMLEFISRNGPYYDTERWRFDGSQYYLCEKLRQTYYAGADNMYVIVRQMHFDRQGKVQSITCRPIGDYAEKVELLLAAEVAVPLYSKPGNLQSRSGGLEPGSIVRVLDYKMSTFGPGTPALWYKVGPLQGRGITGWCCVTLDDPSFPQDSLNIADTPKGTYKVLGARRGADGIELLLDNGSGAIVLKGFPLVMRPINVPRAR